jgi:TonB family protein
MRLCTTVISLFCACNLTLTPATHAQSTEASVKSRLMNKPLYLRGCWSNNKLHFDSLGQRIGTSRPVPFTLCGFDLKYVRAKRDKLILEGERVGLELADGNQKRVTLQVGTLGDSSSESIHIEVNASPNSDYDQALDAIFIEDLAALVPSLPFYWQNYAHKNFLPAAKVTATATPSTTPQAQAHGISGNIKPPRPLRAPDPDWSNIYTRALNYGGTVLINLQVNADGTVTRLSIVRALGMGLDESALAAVQKYVFEPATQNGQPIPIELNIAVNFPTFRSAP